MKQLAPDRQKAAAATLAEAFRDDPLMEVLAPDVRRRPTVSDWFFAKGITYGLRWGEVWTNDDTSAVAIWMSPGNTSVTLPRMLRAGMGAMPFRVGLNGTSRLLRAMSATERMHKSVEGPHWYLLALGTRPAVQKTGQGSALIKVGFERADAAGLPVYLETATESNVAFYSKRGFEVTAREAVLGFTIYGMVRGPSAN
jgi:ribosomal protein S18 acetylase RimI-like enzyme